VAWREDSRSGFRHQRKNPGGVEEWRGDMLLRFHSPLFKLDGRFSRIQLSDKASHTFAHERLRRRRVLS
jgi:hypothetical protein